MPVKKKTAARSVRRSISLSHEVDSEVKKLAQRQNWSATRVIEDLVQAGLEAKEAEKKRFFELAERLRTATDGPEIERIKHELARMTFGE